MSDRAEGTFVLLRYSLGGDRPSQTAQLARFHAQIHGTWLELKLNKGGISPVTPRKLALPLQSLPPILHITSLMPVQSCSKGARGLSV